MMYLSGRVQPEKQNQKEIYIKGIGLIRECWLGKSEILKAIRKGRLELSGSDEAAVHM